jgi:XTP/dITP diphosphohydrolase
VRELILCTRNRHKIIELQDLLRALFLSLKSLDDFPSFPQPPEDGQTFEENATDKALHSSLALKRWCLADDSGLEVEALGGRPGILSARYAKTNPERIARLLRELEGIPPLKRTARFVCAMSLSDPEGNVVVRTGYCHGMIAHEPRGTNGFGYDPVFHLPELGKTMAELALHEKNHISHRANAARHLIPIIEKVIDNTGV